MAQTAKRLVIRNAVRELKILKGFRISEEFFKKLDEEVEYLIKKAVERAKARKARKEKTLKAYHL